MKFLSTAALILFYIKALILLSLVALVNLIKYIYKYLSQGDHQKQIISPLTNTHQDVFSPLCTFQSTQMTSSLSKATT